MGITFHTMLRHLVGHRSAIRRANLLSFASIKLRDFTKTATVINLQAYVALISDLL